MNLTNCHPVSTESSDTDSQHLYTSDPVSRESQQDQRFFLLVQCLYARIRKGLIQSALEHFYVRMTEHGKVVSSHLVILDKFPIIVPFMDQFDPFVITPNPMIHGRHVEDVVLPHLPLGSILREHVDRVEVDPPPADDLVMSQPGIVQGARVKVLVNTVEEAHVIVGDVLVFIFEPVHVLDAKEAMECHELQKKVLEASVQIHLA